MKIVLCQYNPLVGDVNGNAERVCDALRRTAAGNPDILVFPELFIQGYPPRDLLEQRWFIRSSREAVQKICECSRQFPGIGVLIGTALPNDLPFGKGLSNAALLIEGGGAVFHQAKSLLPAYDVFDETRYFDPAAKTAAFPFKGERLGITVCEDAWNHEELWTRGLYERDPLGELAAQGATLFINIAASPFHIGKENLRASLMKKHARSHGIPLVYLNQVGGNDDLVFDGNSMFFDGRGGLHGMLPAFEEAEVTVDTAKPGPVRPLPDFDTIEAVRNALVMGIRDYARKCGFSKALVGLSGGVDSALTCALAVDALGAAQVWGVALPSRFSSAGSVEDARLLAENLGIRFSVIPINDAHQALLETLKPHFEGTSQDTAEENLQARIRGTLLMALSNKFGHLLLTTGNKSEIAVGYCTLYGDMCGGLGVISDLPKEMVYRLARSINTGAGRDVIPQSTLTKPPSAELRPGQTDQDTLPSYPVLDALLERIVEKGDSFREAVEQGFNEADAGWVCRAIAASEYKRRQAAPGLKVTPKAFGTGRRFPIAARFER